MANRMTLHINKLQDFKKWLTETGWEIVPVKGEYEVLRAITPGRQHPLIIYRKANAKEHLSVMDRDYAVIDMFLHHSSDKSKLKQSRTNADCIRSMNDEQLAAFLVKVKIADHPCMEGEADCKWEDWPMHNKGCKDCFLEWLNSKETIDISMEEK